MDVYDAEVAYLTEHPDEIQDAWFAPKLAPGGLLFGFLTKDHRCKGCNCPAGVKNGVSSSGNLELDALIKESDIPRYSDEIRPQHLAAFARIMRAADRILERSPYVRPI